MADLEERIRQLPFGDAAVDIARVGIQLLIIAVVAYVALRLARIAVRSFVAALLDRETVEGTAQELSAIEVRKRRDTLEGLGYALTRAFIVAVALVMALDAFDLDIGPAIAGLGIAGVAVGLGAQHLVRDYLAGAFILVENHYAKGDVVKIADVTGTVEDFDLRRTTLRDFDGTVHSVPNGLIGVASNLTRIWARVTLDLTVPADADFREATRLLDEAGREMREDETWGRRLLDTPRVERVQALAEQGVTLRLAGTVRAADRWDAAGELRRRALERLAAAGIRIVAG
jgi:small conductance mechanosensitive channel